MIRERARRADRGRRVPRRRPARRRRRRCSPRSPRRGRCHRAVEPGHLDRADPRACRACATRCATTAAPVVAVSPLVRGAVLKGPTDGVPGVGGAAADERRDRGALRRAARRPRRPTSGPSGVPTLETDVRDAATPTPAAGVAHETLVFARRAARVASRAPMRTVAVLPVKSFGRAKQRLGAAVGGRTAPGSPPRWSATCSRRSARCEALDERGRRDRGAARRRRRRARRARWSSHDPVEAGQSAAAALRRRRPRSRAAPSACCSCPATARRSIRPRSTGAARRLRRRRACVIVPDRHGSGTNALLLDAADVLAPAFGPGSFARHAALAARGRRDRARRAGCRRSSSTSTRRATSPPCAPRSRARPAPRRARARCSRGCARGRLTRDLAPSRCPACRRSGPGDDLAALLRDAAARLPTRPAAGDVLVIAHKVVSKAEGRVRAARRRRAPGRGRAELAAEHGKDPRLVEADPRRDAPSSCAPTAAA